MSLDKLPRKMTIIQFESHILTSLNMTIVIFPTDLTKDFLLPQYFN